MKLNFPAMKGLMGGREYYVAILKLSELPRLLTFRNWAELPPEDRAQRVLTTARVPEIARYLEERVDGGWIFSSITVSCQGALSFQPLNGDGSLGHLEVEAGAPVIINDGQHRFAGIERALENRPDLGEQTISLVVFPYENLERTQQMFSDLNRSARPTSKSLNVLFDHTDQIGRITKELVEEIPVFRGWVDMARVSLAKRSPKLTTLSAVYDAIKVFLTGDLGRQALGNLGGRTFDEALRTAREYFTELTARMSVWQDVSASRLRSEAARAEYVCCHAILFRALGLMGYRLTKLPEVDWQSRLDRLKEIDWRRVAVNPTRKKVWEGLCLAGGDIVNNQERLRATADYLTKIVCGDGQRERENEARDNIGENPARGEWFDVSPHPSEPRRGQRRALDNEQGQDETFCFEFSVNDSFLTQSNHPITIPKEFAPQLEQVYHLGLPGKENVKIEAPGVAIDGHIYRAQSGRPGPVRSIYWQLRANGRLPVCLSTLKPGSHLAVAAIRGTKAFRLRVR